jgi:MFS family permease
VWPLFAIYGLFPALTDGVAKALAVDTAGTAGRATVIGIYSSVIGLTQIAASLMGGLLWDNVSARATFYFGAAMSALSVALLFALIPARTR